MTPTRGNIQRFKEKTDEGSGMFLNGKDYANARRIRPIAWIYNGVIIDVKLYLEGWYDVKGKQNGQCIRFEVDEEIPQGQYAWKKGEYNGKPTVNSPDVAIAFLHYDYNTSSIKLSSFTQKTIINQINNYITDEIEGKKNEFFVPDLSKVDVIIGKTSPTAYSVTIQQTESPKGLPDLLDNFRFSWEAFMGCGECFGDKAEISYEDVLEAAGAAGQTQQTKQSNKTITKGKGGEPEFEEEPAAVDLDWKKVKTSKGNELGKLTKEQIGTLAEKIVNAANPNPSTDLYKALVLACEHHEIELDDIPF